MRTTPSSWELFVSVLAQALPVWLARFHTSALSSSSWSVPSLLCLCLISAGSIRTSSGAVAADAEAPSVLPFRLWSNLLLRYPRNPRYPHADPLW